MMMMMMMSVHVQCAWKDIAEKQIFLPSLRAQTDETSSHLGNSGPRYTLF